MCFYSRSFLLLWLFLCLWLFLFLCLWLFLCLNITTQLIFFSIFIIGAVARKGLALARVKTDLGRIISQIKKLEAYQPEEA